MKFLNPILLAAGLLVLWSCDSTKPLAVGGGDETHSTIDIQGAVFTNRSEPFAGIVVRLRHLGISDTTDSKGIYRFQRADTLLTTKPGAVDTIDYLREGRVVHSEAVPSWTATMPDLFLVQRDISGKLSGEVAAVKAVEAIFGTDRSDTLALEWNPVLGSYSGFAYAPWDGTGTVVRYQVRIEVRDSLHHLIGRSVDIPFTSRAGDLDIPSFPAGNAKPYLKIVGKDTAASREFLELHAVAVDSFGQKVMLQWREARFDRFHRVVDSVTGAAFRQTDADTVVHIAMPGGRDSTFTIHCMATDEDGNIVQDSLVVHRRFNEPIAKFTLKLDGDSVHVHMDASTVNKGQILERKLFLGSRQAWLLENDVSCMQAVYSTDPLSGWSQRSFGWPVNFVGRGTIGTSCPDDVDWTEYLFVKRDSGVLVSGRDTTFLLPPKDAFGRPFQFAIQLLDEDSQTGVWRSEPFAQVVAPESLRVSVVHPDTTNGIYGSIRVAWKVPDSGAYVDQFASGIPFEYWEITWKNESMRYPEYLRSYARTDSTALLPYDSAGGCITVRQGTRLGYSKPISACITRAMIAGEKP